MTAQRKSAQLKIFRASEAPSLVEAGCMSLGPMSGVQQQGFRDLVQAGYLHGEETRILVDLPGFSLVHAWLKSGYPLTRHSHNSDCLYYVVAGSLRLGTNELGPQDSFFVPGGVPYTYAPGPQGVEVLEFRHSGSFNFMNLSHHTAFWEKATQACRDNLEGWRQAVPPSAQPHAPD